ncbi:MAG: hypothetical protein SF028_11215 [Candidatus Sumerlaeia bacterium]|nr:hypothetical protein [Candidatus Sumerlaeia bacterium]
MAEYDIWGNDSAQGDGDALRKMPLSFEHNRLKAKRMTLGDYEVVAAYDKPKFEYHSLRREVGVMDVSYLTFVRASGSERREVLHKQLTANFESFQEGQLRRAFLLNDAGGFLADVEVVALGEFDLMVAPPTLPADRLISAMNRNLLMEDVSFEDTADTVTALAIVGENKGWLARALGLDFGRGEERTIRPARVGGQSVHLFRSDYFGSAPIILCRGAGASTVWQTLVAAVRELDGLPVGHEAFDAWRIEHGVLWYGPDLGTDSTPLDADLARCVDFAKDVSFPGREALLKVRQNADPPQRFCGLILDVQRPPEGTIPLRFSEGLPAGTLKSVGFSRQRNKYVGVGLIKWRDPLPWSPLIMMMPDGSTADASVVPLPFPEELGIEEEAEF